MVAPHKYTDEEIALIISERAKGSSFRAIGKMIGVCGSSVREMLGRRKIQTEKAPRKVKPKTFEEYDNFWTIVKTCRIALAIAKKQNVSVGFRGLLVHQAGRSSIRPKITIFECEKNPGAVPGEGTSGG